MARANPDDTLRRLLYNSESSGNSHMSTWFNVRKAAQVVAFFAREQGGSIDVLKLAKLVYIADRKNMEKYEYPISGDKLVSMDHGPVNSITLNLINGLDFDRAEWDEFVSDRAAHEVGSTKNVSDDDLDELSEAELETLNEVWAGFGHMGKYEIRDWTHKNCPEWEDPSGSSNPIPYARVFKFLGKDNAEQLAAQIESERKLRATLAAA